MIKHIKICVMLLLAALLFVGCYHSENGTLTFVGGELNASSDAQISENSTQDFQKDNHELIVPIVDECRVSSKRTGTKRQGIYALDNGFECTDNGCYWMCMSLTGNWLLYSDHGSDTVIKLCGRPDCSHSGKDCNAYFEGGVNICYYDGYLYTLGDEGLIRVNLDGSERLPVFDLPTFKAEQHFRGLASPEIWNGVFTFGLTKLDDAGRQIATIYYYKLDGSMKAPEETEVLMSLMKTDGDAFCGAIGYDAENRQYIYGKWNPEINTTTEFFKYPEMYPGTGYIGSEALYYIENGVIYEYKYATGAVSALLDTGVEGTYQLSCFPDVLVVSDYSEEADLENLTLRFYDWGFNDLGSARIDFPFSDGLPGVICGETHERIMLTDSIFLVPRYYIEKSDLGSGNITIHEYEWDFEWD